MTLDQWLALATRGLSHESVARVHTEIKQHCEAVLERGEDPIRALGDPNTANREYRKVLITASEARVLHSRQCELRAISRRPWMKWLMLAAPVLFFDAALLSVLFNSMLLARAYFSAALMLGAILVPPFFPIYTATRSRYFRALKWAALLASVILMTPYRYFWLINGVAALPYLAYIDWMNMRLRRKLPPSQWPKQLFL